MELKEALSELQQAYEQFGELQNRLLHMGIHHHEAVMEQARQGIPGKKVIEAYAGVDELATHTRKLIRQLERTADSLALHVPDAHEYLARIDHLSVTIRLYDRIIRTASPFAREASPNAVLTADLPGRTQETLQQALNKAAPLPVGYLYDPKHEPIEPDVFALETTSRTEAAEYIALRFRDAGYSIRLSDGFDRLMQKADTLVHHFYGLQGAYGKDAAAKGIAAVAEMHDLVKELGDLHRKEHGAAHPLLEQNRLSDFACVGMALQRTAETWKAEGAAAALAAWNRETTRIHNFNRIESDKLTPWAQRIGQKRPMTPPTHVEAQAARRGSHGKLSLDSL